MTLRTVFSRRRGFALALGGAAVVGTFSIATGLVLHSRWKHAERELRSHRTELAKLLAVQPALGAAGEAEVVAELAATSGEIQARAATWASGERTAAGDPLLELAESAARLRLAAHESRVKLSAGERFGFAEFARTAPVAAESGALRRQRIFSEDVLARLFAAGATELLEVRRAPATGGDRFECPVAIAHARPGLLESDALRVTFLGGTESLRALLNALAAPGARCVVVGVDTQVVSPAPSSGQRQLRVALTVERMVPVGDVAGLAPGISRPKVAESAPEVWPQRARSTALFGESRGPADLAAPAMATPAVRPFPLRLLRVEPRPARVELLGSSELRGEPRVLLRDRQTGAVSLLARGGRCPELEVELLDFQEARSGEPARATLRDLRGGAELRLGGSTAAPPEEWQAVLSSFDAANRSRRQVVSLGARLRSGEVDYRVAAISANPPAVVLTAFAENNLPTATVRLEISP